MIDTIEHTAASPAFHVIELTGHARCLRRRIEVLTARYRELDCIATGIHRRPGPPERFGG